MEHTEMVVVYRYRYWDPKTNEMILAAREATLVAIKSGLGVPVIESGRKVALSSIDRQGRVREGDEQLES